MQSVQIAKTRAFVGIIEEVGKLAKTGKTPAEQKKGLDVLNVEILMNAKNRFGIVTELTRRAVFFRGLAKRAARALKTGDRLFVDECELSKQTFEGKRSKRQITTLDIIPRAFAVISAEQMTKVEAALENESFEEEQPTVSPSEAEQLVE